MTFGSFLDPKCCNPYYEDPRNPYMSRDSRIALHSPPAVGLATLSQRNLQVGIEQVGTLHRRPKIIEQQVKSHTV